MPLPAPAVNTDAEDYIHLVDIRGLVKNGEMTQTPYTRNMDQATLQNFTQQALRTRIPAHTQSTERAVNLTAESAAAVFGAEQQDGAALNKRAYRREFPGQVTKRNSWLQSKRNTSSRRLLRDARPCPAPGGRSSCELRRAVAAAPLTVTH